jgi:hypothetical protein
MWSLDAGTNLCNLFKSNLKWNLERKVLYRMQFYGRNVIAHFLNGLIYGDKNEFFVHRTEKKEKISYLNLITTISGDDRKKEHFAKRLFRKETFHFRINQINTESRRIGVELIADLPFHKF